MPEMMRTFVMKGIGEVPFIEKAAADRPRQRGQELSGIEFARGHEFVKP